MALSFNDLPKRKHKPSDQLKRRHKGKFDYAQFIGWDGEGITRSDGHHTYTLFANSLGIRVRGTVEDSMSGLSGIRTSEILRVLIQSATDNPKAIHVIFYGSYDFNMLLQDLPIQSLERIRKGLKTYYEQYSIEVRFHKKLWVKDRNTGVTCTLWDVGSFFQTSFVSALQAWKVPTQHLDNIIRQKANRATFTDDQADEIEEYCRQELEALVMLMEQFHDALAHANLRINAWHGPGAIAETLFKQHSIKSHKKVCPDDINTASQYAYGAGRIELARQGHWNGNTYSYDIRSCYPFHISQLPSLNNASWLYVDNRHNDIRVESRPMSLYCVSWDFPDGHVFYPGRHRHTSGGITYPQSSVGTWVWTPEYELLRDYFPNHHEVHEAYLFYNPKPDYPFRWIEDVYHQRQQWKREGNAAQGGLKLGLNSMYGKMIQQLGYRDDKLPAYHQLEWGGYVTASARAQLFRAAATNPSSIIGFETDGILTTSPLDVELSEELGGWERDLYTGCTYVQSGLYWLDHPTTPKTKYRGFDKGTVRRDSILSAWESDECQVHPIGECNSQHIEAQLTRHIGLNYAMHTNNMEQWGDWITAPRYLDIGSATSKRHHVCDPINCRSYGVPRSQALHDTKPYGEGTSFSAPYPLIWKDNLPEWKIEEMENDREYGDYVTWFNG